MHTGNRDIVTSSHDVARKDEEILPGPGNLLHFAIENDHKNSGFTHEKSMVDLSIVFWWTLTRPGTHKMVPAGPIQSLVGEERDSHFMGDATVIPNI